MRKVALAAVLAALGCGAAEAATRYSSVLFFGDSLTDNGNLYTLTSATLGQGIPPAPYYQGRTSNGPVWADHVAADFAAKGLYSANYAYAYGQAVTNVDTQFGGLQVPDLPAQVDAFKASGSAGLLGERPVATLWFGANDLFTAMPGGLGPVAAAAADAARAVAGGIEALGDSGIRDFLVFNMPPLQDTPRFATLGTPEEAALAAFGVGVFNATLDGLLESAGPETRVTKFDVNAVMDELMADPARFGVTDVSTPCFIPTTGQLLCTPEQAALHAFWDPVHPSGTIHAAIADEVRADIAPIPLPAPVLLLLAGMAGLAVAGRRRQV
ncbi:MAG TPA: SGNH/GDSL hydrolase family protein [Amaricoccus sp.]|nr:SGNH/GDSL hydrolase family protein [Amaricoccus sp.]